MEKEFESLEMLSKNIRYKKEYIRDDLYRLYITEDALDFLEQVLNELKAIKESEPSEALKSLERIKNISFCIDYEKDICTSVNELIPKACNKVEQALLKAQEQEKENAEYKEVLRIIFEKNVDIDFLKSATTFDEYNKLIKFKNPFAIALTQEEFNLLKRWLK